MQNKGILMVISGFSGAGKGTLVKKLLSEYDNYALSISMTTRQPREGEEDGREYFFRTREQFEENIAKNGFIEYAQYCGNYYGTPKAYVEEQMQAGCDLRDRDPGSHEDQRAIPGEPVTVCYPSQCRRTAEETGGQRNRDSRCHCTETVPGL